MKIADDAQSIKARMEEIQRERMQAIMGKPIEETEAKKVEEYLGGSINIEPTHTPTWGYFATDDLPTA